MREDRYVSYELMSSREERIGLKSGWFLTVMPYSVSIPITFEMAMTSPDFGSLRVESIRREGEPTLPPAGRDQRYWPVLMTRSTARCLSFTSPMRGLT